MAVSSEYLYYSFLDSYPQTYAFLPVGWSRGGGWGERGMRLGTCELSRTKGQLIQYGP